ncbi:MAG: 3-oxoacyl-ACP reductase FabG [Gammaproteobacteria bacterium]|nr:3-oxoacyl-ACP reductase FabG [Gammaproteobacteria bacterium]
MGRLDGRRALITGASSGIGAGVAIAFAREGADVAINYPTEAEREAAQRVAARVRASGRRALPVCADVADAGEVDRMVDETIAAFGGVDILVNNAGIAHTAPVEEIPIEIWDRLIAVHLRSVFLATRRVLPLMYAQDYGKIINTASQLAYKGAPGLTHYTAAKGAILSFTRSLALEIGTRNVNANCVAPGATRTPILDAVPDAVLEAIRLSIPRQRIAEVDDIVPAYVFLASDDGRHFQGQCLSPNGGDVFL